MKDSHFFPPPETNHLGLDRRWQDWFPVRLFERQSLSDGDVISDLARHVIRARNADVIGALLKSLPSQAFLDFTEADTPLPQGPFRRTGVKSIEGLLAEIERGIVAQLANLLSQRDGGRALDHQIIITAMSGLEFHDRAE